MRNEEVKGTIDDLCSVNEKNDILTFYKRVLKDSSPTIIDLIGTTGAGKTTFCQQFVDDEGKKILGKTISSSGNSTIIQTELVILEDTKNRLFLKARTKSDIISDLMVVALNIDTEFKFDVKKSITDDANMAGVKNSNNEVSRFNIKLFQGVYNLFRTNKLLQKFQKIAKDLQLNLKKENNTKKYVNDDTANKDLTLILEDIIYSKLRIENFYGGRHEISMDHKNILEKTIIPTKIFDKYKERLEEFREIVSFRLLFEQAILVLRCNEKVKKSLPEKFKKGVVIRELQIHKKIGEEVMPTNFEGNYKVILIPVATGGGIVDDRLVEELKNVITSEPKESIVVLTKIDKASSYVEYTQNNYEGFIDGLKEQIVTSHNNLMGKRLVVSFNNVYLSKITKDRQGNYDAELHKIICRNKTNREISVNDIEDIVIIDEWHSLVSGF
ncbi:hypothetical protein [Clostridium estertheticum]|uniref:hypothetical protein n=1 Tax=Clostridium estertheticum TaxID=238834 RepID=UPI001C7D48FA|nr:hypothetical protein [Clostridium estertheticum]MBX4263017.1 hypothetical protein [Clostridium estertheticum]WLC89338.1 hypothetical protein KTC95_03690 [Clostridium estertheticum]